MAGQGSIEAVLTRLSRLSLALTLAVSLVTCGALVQIWRTASYAYANTVPSLVALGALAADVGELKGMTGAHILADTPEKTKSIDGDLSARLTAVDRKLSEYKALVSDDKERALYEATQREWQHMLTTLPDLRQQSLAVQTASATDLFNRAFVPANDKVSSAIGQMVAYNRKLAEDAASQSALYGSIGLALGVLGSLLLTGCAVLVRIVSRRRVIQPLSDLLGSVNVVAGGKLDSRVACTDLGDEVGSLAKAFDAFRVVSLERSVEQVAQAKVVANLTEGLERLAAGNLVYRIENPFDPRYETLRHSFNQASAGLAESLQSVSLAANRVNTGASEIFMAAQDLADRNERQAASIEETNGSMKTVARTTDASATDAKDMQDSIACVVESAQVGETVVSAAVTAMSAIEESSQKISQIVDVIDGIAFQTNLLALNAGVEAARAGESGRGFAVVATEVRALAQRSAEAAREISALIASSTDQVATGVKLVTESGDKLHEISGALVQSISIVGKIASSSADQAISVGEVSSAISEIDKMTQKNAAMAEECNAAASNLTSSAKELAALVSRFELPSGMPARSAHLLQRAA